MKIKLPKISFDSKEKNLPFVHDQNFLKRTSDTELRNDFGLLNSIRNAPVIPKQFNYPG